MTNETTAPELIWAVTEPDDVSAQILGDVYAQQVPDGMVGEPVEYVRADALEAAQARIAELEGALERVMVGGNHLALIIGADHPPFDAGVIWAMNVYGASTDKYNAWCCWSEIMKARAALEGKG